MDNSKAKVSTSEALGDALSKSDAQTSSKENTSPKSNTVDDTASNPEGASSKEDAKDAERSSDTAASPNDPAQSDCYSYDAHGILVYTDPKTKQEFVLSGDSSQWVPKDQYEYDGETYRYTDEQGNKFKWNLTSKSWEKDEEEEEESEEDDDMTEEEKQKRRYRKRKAQPGWGQKNNYYTDESGKQCYKDSSDGMVYEWDTEKNAWFPKIDEDFMAQYQMNYGFTKDGVAEPTRPEEPASNSDDIVNKPKAEDGKPSKQNQQPKWFEEDASKSTKVYISNLPENIDEDKLEEFMKKCGMIEIDVRSNRPKIKVYRDSNGQPKGDALCTYMKVESVQLALNILDGSNLDGKVVNVERAKFEMKGNKYNPKLKPKKLSKKELETLKRKHQKLFEWHPDQLRGERPKKDKVIVIKNLFDPAEFDLEPQKILEYSKNLREKCEKFGNVKNIVIYDKHPEGVTQVFFSSPTEADMAIEMLDKRLFYNGKIMEAQTWDGKTKYKVNETEEEEKERLANWDKFLEGDDDESEEHMDKKIKLDDQK